VTGVWAVARRARGVAELRGEAHARLFTTTFNRRHAIQQYSRQSSTPLGLTRPVASHTRCSQRPCCRSPLHPCCLASLAWQPGSLEPPPTSTADTPLGCRRLHIRTPLPSAPALHPCALPRPLHVGRRFGAAHHPQSYTRCQARRLLCPLELGAAHLPRLLRASGRLTR